MENTKEAALQWAMDGKSCQYREGWAYRGAKAKPITSKDAQKRLRQEKGWALPKKTPKQPRKRKTSEQTDLFN